MMDVIKSMNQALLEQLNQLSEQVRRAKAMTKVMLHAHVEEISSSTYFDYFEALHNILLQADHLTEQITCEVETFKKELTQLTINY